MTDLNISINRRNYLVACDDGQEDHLRYLAQVVDKRVEELVAAMGQVGDQRLLIMASLILADEVEDTRQQLAQLQEETRTKDVMSAPEAALANGIVTLAERIESLAERLERE